MGVEPRYNDVAMPLFYMIEEETEHKMFYDLVVKNVEVDLSQREETNEGQILASIKKLIETADESSLIRGFPRVYLAEVVLEMKAAFYSDSNEREIEKFVNSKSIGWKLKGLGIKTKKDGNNQGKKYVDPDSFEDLSSLYARFGIKDEPKIEFLLTESKIESIMGTNNE